MLQEEQETEREKAYEKRLEELDDVVPGEERGDEAEIASKKSLESIKSVRLDYCHTHRKTTTNELCSRRSFRLFRQPQMFLVSIGRL